MLDWMVQTSRGLFLQGPLGVPHLGAGLQLGVGPQMDPQRSSSG